MIKKITAIALDDEPLALQLIKQHSDKIDFLDVQKYFTNPDEFLEYLKENEVDLVFLDIQMPDVNGLQLYKNLKKPPQVIFTTAFKNYAIEGFNLDAIDYLLKPFEFDRFKKAVEKAKDYIEYLKEKEINLNTLYVKVNYEMTRVNLKEIDLIEALDDYIKLHVKPVPVLTLMTLKIALEKLPAKDFLRVHRSYIIPLSRVERFTRTKIFLKTGKDIPIGSSYTYVYDTLMQHFNTIS
jgi:DNA-binding LytR/AlgR family response regulator